MINELMEALQLHFESAMSDINTATPGTIVSYDATKNRAVVNVTLPKALSNGDSLDGPQIVEVPVIWPASNAGKSSFTMPLQPGDGVMLSFQQRSLEGWLNGNNQAPDDPRHFDLSDAVAHPGLSHNSITGDPDNVVLKFDKTSFTLTNQNQAILANDKCNTLLNDNGNYSINSSATINIGNAGASMVMDDSGGVTINSPNIVLGGSGLARAPGNVSIANSNLSLSQPPTASNHATTKGYVDSAIAGGGTPQTITLTGDVTGSGTTSIATTLINTNVTAGNYTYASFTVDAKGRLTLASSGTPPPGASTVLPLMDGTATVGTSLNYAREGHIHPTDTSRYAASNPSGYVNQTQTDTRYLQLIGGTLTGPLIQAADPVNALGTATKQYVDNHSPLGGPYLPLTGGTLTGALTLSADPTAALQPVTKQMYDALLARVTKLEGHSQWD